MVELFSCMGYMFIFQTWIRQMFLKEKMLVDLDKETSGKTKSKAFGQSCSGGCWLQSFELRTKTVGRLQLINAASSAVSATKNPNR